MQCGDYTYRVIDTGAEIMEYYGQGGEITLPETLDSLPVVSVGLCAFIMRTDLTAVTLPKTLRHIGGSAFEGCSALTSITLNEGWKPSSTARSRPAPRCAKSRSPIQ